MRSKISRKSRKFIVGLISTLLLISGCDLFNSDSPGQQDTNITPIYSQDYWGEWVSIPMYDRIDNSLTMTIARGPYYISADQVYINGREYSVALHYRPIVEVSSLSENVKKINFIFPGSGESLGAYLFASRIKNGSFSGTIADFDSTSRSSRNVAKGKGWINVVVSDLANPDDTTTVTTDGEGNFTVDNTIHGDIYQIDVDGQTATVTPTTDDANIGTITIADGVNFKINLTPPETGIDFTRLYADGTNYPFYIHIENTGTEDATACTYSLTLDNGLILVSGNTSGILGTVEPGAKKTKYLPFTVSCTSVQTEYEFKTIYIQITDAINDKTWNDSVSLRFHRKSVSFKIAAQSVVQGIILAPTGKAYQFSGTNTSVVVPWSSKDYLVVFCGASANTETVYSLGIDVDPNKAFSDFNDVANYEPNNTEENAFVINSQDQIMSYLHKGDFDYYRIKL